MASNDIRVNARERLMEEFKAWETNHPKDFFAEPSKTEDGALDMLNWKCAVPGKVKTPWAGASYKLNVQFPEDYPYSPPKCQFNPPIFHPNVFPSGTVSLSLIDKDNGWKPQTTFKEREELCDQIPWNLGGPTCAGGTRWFAYPIHCKVLVGIQLLLGDPNFDNPAQAEAPAVYFKSQSDYEQRVTKQAMEIKWR